MALRLVRLAVLVGVLLGASAAAQAQFTAAVRVSPCIHRSLGLSSLVASGFCNLYAYFEKRGSFGIYAEVSPKYGLPLDNWELMAYRPLELNLAGLQVGLWPGLAVGEQEGSTYVRIQSDIVISLQY